MSRKDALEAVCGALSGGGLTARVVGLGGGNDAIVVTGIAPWQVVISDNDGNAPIDEDGEYTEQIVLCVYRVDDFDDMVHELPWTTTGPHPFGPTTFAILDVLTAWAKQPTPTHLFCNNCQRKTPVADRWLDGARCLTCGDNYSCQVCGFDIDRAGTCLRETTTGEKVHQ
jgi:hypothetical protein